MEIHGYTITGLKPFEKNGKKSAPVEYRGQRYDLCNLSAQQAKLLGEADDFQYLKKGKKDAPKPTPPKK